MTLESRINSKLANIAQAFLDMRQKPDFQETTSKLTNMSKVVGEWD